MGTQPLIWIVDDSPTQRAIILLAAASAQSSRAREEFGSHEDVLRAAPDFATYARESGMRALAAITTCLELTGLAIATAMRSEADRVEIRFHQEMIGIVSHDLRSPRSALSMDRDAAHRRNAEASRHAGADRQKHPPDVIGIVDQLLDVTRSRIGQGIHISPSETTIRGVVTDVLEEMRLAQPSLQATLSGDDSRMWWRKRALSTRTATSRSLLKLERRLSDDHYVACLREATVASVFWRS